MAVSPSRTKYNLRSGVLMTIAPGGTGFEKSTTSCSMGVDHHWGPIRRSFVFLFSADKVRRMRKLICLLVVALHLSSCGLNYHFCPPGQEHDPSRPFASCRPTTTPGANER